MWKFCVPSFDRSCFPLRDGLRAAVEQLCPAVEIRGAPESYLDRYCTRNGTPLPVICSEIQRRAAVLMLPLEFATGLWPTPWMKLAVEK
jgi:hypothetical protein